MAETHIGDRCFSLVELHEAYECPFVLCSMPENGADPQNDFQGGYSAPVMKIVESLPAHLRDDVALVNAVDFAGSTSADFCSSRVRALTKRGNILRDGEIDTEEFPTARFLKGEQDFDFDHHIPLGAGTKCDRAKAIEKKIENSFWICFWRGKVSGALTATFASMGSREQRRMSTPPATPEHEDASFIRNDYGGPFFSLAATFCDYGDEDPDESESHSTRTNHRTVCMLSVDGGAITQVEKKHLASIGKSVLSDIRRRKNDWSGECQLMWCHFPSVVDLLASLCGCRNLKRDEDEERCASRDTLGISTTMGGFDYTTAEWLSTKGLRKDPERLDKAGVDKRDFSKSVTSLLVHDVPHIYANSQEEMTVERLLDAAANDDGDGIAFILKQAPELLDAKGVNARMSWEDFSLTALGVASFFGCYDAAKTLIEAGADLKVPFDVPGEDEPASALMAALMGVRLGTGNANGALKIIHHMFLAGVGPDDFPDDLIEQFKTHIREFKEEGPSAAHDGHPVLCSERGFEEHCTVLQNLLRLIQDGPEIRDLVTYKIREFDTDKNGVLSRKEISDVLKELEGMLPADVDKLMGEFGSSDDATVAIEDFVDLLFAHGAASEEPLPADEDAASNAGSAEMEAPDV